jgi:hypothetical protein
VIVGIESRAELLREISIENKTVNSYSNFWKIQKINFAHFYEFYLLVNACMRDWLS